MTTRKYLQSRIVGWVFALLPILGGMPALAANVDTGQDACYNNSTEIACPRPGQPFYGQDAQYTGQTPRYRDNGDGTVTDLNTGLMWSRGLSNHKVTPEEGARLAAQQTLGGYSDWRLPTIKELYSLIDFRGRTGTPGRGRSSRVPADAIPFINTDYFDFAYGDVAGGERYIDAQWLSSTRYVSTTMNGMETMFGVNFADGRIKGYGYRPIGNGRIMKTFYVRYVRGKAYGNNAFIDNGDGTVTDRSTGLTWMQRDSGRGMNWQQALAYAEKLEHASHDDWRLPNAKELQTLVDYSRAPDTTGSPAIDPVFQTSVITNEAGRRDFPFFWTSTTHQDGPRPAQAVYVAFGRAIGQLHGRTLDVHGAGAQRSDPKSGRARLGHGPQGDAQRVMNYVRCVRGGATMGRTTAATNADSYPNKIRLVTLEHDPDLNLGPQAQELRQRDGMQHPTGMGPFPAAGPPANGKLPGGSDFGERQLNGPPPGGQGGFVARLDRDGDGKVSRFEFDGPPDRFDVHDANYDGYLTEDEAPKLPPGRQRGRS